MYMRRSKLFFLIIISCILPGGRGQPADSQADRVPRLHGGGCGHRIPLDRVPPLWGVPVRHCNKVQSPDQFLLPWFKVRFLH
jgi:hypothetical protein